MRKSTFRRLLQKYLKGKATEAERYIVDRWYDSFEDNLPDVPGLANPSEKAAMQSRIFKGIHYPDKRITWYQHKSFRVAASIVLTVGLSLGLYHAYHTGQLFVKPSVEAEMASQVIHTDHRQLKKIQLPDGTLVWLNANSRLEVMPGYAQKNRYLKLSGEAFFDVKRDTTRPFLVATDHLITQVLGTTFNVQAYDDLQTIKIIVSTGKVLVRDSTGQPTVELEADQGIAYHKTDQSFQLESVFAANSHSWREGRIMLERASFEELAQQLYNLYHVRLQTANEEVQSYHYNLTLSATQRLDEAMELICTILKKHYRKEANGDIVIY